MKKILFGIIPLAALLLTGCSSMVTMENYDDADKFLVGSQTYEGDLTEMNIYWHFGEVTLVEDESVNYVKLEEENELAENLKVHSYYRETKLDVRFAAPKVMAMVESKDKNLTVTYHPGLTKLNLHLSSGKVTAEKLTASTVDITFSSGSVNVNKITAPTLNVNFSSGKIVAQEVVSENMTVHFSSGSAEFDKIDTVNFTHDSSSGTLISRFNTLTKANIKYSSGSSIIKTPVNGATVSVHKSSGRVNINTEYTKLDDGRYVIGEGGAEINVNFSSGSTNIY